MRAQPRRRPVPGMIAPGHDFEYDPIGRLPRGEQVLQQALLGRPEVLLLDEPTSGLDPIGIRDARDWIHHARTQGATILVSSHVLSEVERVCDHAAILHEGVLEACASMDELTSAGILVRIVLGSLLTPEAHADLVALSCVKSLERTSNTEFNVELELESAQEKDEALKAINKVLIGKHDLVPRSLNEGASLETRFLEMTGGTYDVASGT